MQTDKQIVCSRRKRTHLKLLPRFQCENKEDISEKQTDGSVVHIIKDGLLNGQTRESSISAEM